MNWTKIIEDALKFIEENITEDLTVGRIAQEVNTSAFYFQKGFSMLCGYTVGEYIRMRRLSLAGEELVSSDIKVIDLAVKYGYDSADSFTKAFSRFHGSTPTDVRLGGASIKAFAPLHIKLTLDGGKTMEYKIVKKPAFKVMGVSKIVGYGNGYSDIPKFWDEVFSKTQALSYKLSISFMNIDFLQWSWNWQNRQGLLLLCLSSLSPLFAGRSKSIFSGPSFGVYSPYCFIASSLTGLSAK